MHLKLDTRPAAGLAPAVDEEGRHQPVGYWQETAAITPGQPLNEDVTCDVAVIGGGFTGLSTAYHLKRLKPDLDVVLIESAVIGHGASGRNGGFVMPLLGWDLLYTVQKLGDEKARLAYQLMYDAVAYVKHVVKENALACDMEETGYLLLNTSKAREKRSRLEYKTAHRLGFEHQWLEGGALSEHIRSDQFISGVFDPHPCVINPAKLACAMKDLVTNLGVRIYEQTPLLELRDDTPLWMRTPGGTVKAGQVVLAVNGFSEALGFMTSRIMPVHTFIVLTEPLTDAQLNAVGWGQRRTSLESARNFIHYFRLTADNRILFGGEDAKLYYQGRYFDRDDAIFDALKERFRAYFEPLRDVRFTHAWGGVLGVTLDMFPTFGACGAGNRIFYGGGYSGHGVALSNFSGAILAPQVLRATGISPDAIDTPPFFYNRRPVWLGFDPFRYLGVQVYRAALHAQDKVQGA